MTAAMNAAAADRAAGTAALAHLGPNWFAVVMGTGIVANAAAVLPLPLPAVRETAVTVWSLSAAVLLVLVGACVLQWRRYPGAAREHRNHPVMMHFLGAPPMALLTVGAGALLLGRDVLGEPAAVAVDWTLWSLGTVLGLVVAVVVPYRMLTRHRAEPDAAFGGWLMPLVSPMVSAATGALLVPHLPAGQPRTTLILCCAAMFGLSLIAALATFAVLWSRLLHFGTPAPATVPTLWIVLGPVGQSITAAGMLADAGPAALSAPSVRLLVAASVVFGVGMWGFAMLWLALALTVTVGTLRRGELRFTPTWWSFTFPLGTCVTGATTLFRHTGVVVFAVAAVGLYVLLLGIWAVVAARTVRGVLGGTLPAPAGA